MKNIHLPVLLAFLIFTSCEKKSDENVPPKIPDTTQQPGANYVEFAKTLAKALANKEVRSLLKEEALKMFDKDYDVLYGFSKDVAGLTGKSMHEQIAAYANNREQFDKLVDQSPLLTIFIPQLDNFNAAKWNADEQVPIVAVRNLDDKRNGKPLLAYDDNGNEIKLDYFMKPDRPMIVIKENERVFVGNSTFEKNAGRTTRSNIFGKASGGNYTFICDDYNGLKPAPQTERWSSLSLIDPRVITAFDKGIAPQRDYIYYGIDPAQGINEGLLNTNYAEFISGIRVNDLSSKSYIVDDDVTDGMLEIQVTVFFLSNSGNASSLLKVFSCDPAKLFATTRNVNGQLVTSDYALPSPIPITDWNMENYGNTWKFQVTEYDPGTQVTKTTTVTSTFGTNYGININFDLFKKVKIGLNFGGSNTTTKTETTTYTVTGTSDNLGEALLDYSAPILLQKAGGRPGSAPTSGLIYGVNTGTVTLDIETRKRY